LNYAAALETLGLRFRPASPGAKAWLGLTTRNDDGRLVVSQVRRETPAFAAGLNVDDEILAIDDFRVRADQLPARLDQYRPGDRVSVLVARREQLLRLPVTLGAEPARAWRLEMDPGITDAQRTRLLQWLNGEAG
jgi:predicted metalloprotease with PDZ domain